MDSCFVLVRTHQRGISIGQGRPESPWLPGDMVGVVCATCFIVLLFITKLVLFIVTGKDICLEAPFVQCTV